MKPGVTLAIMVKDDAVRLRRALESAANEVDEIVVLDTGSQDNSIEVALVFGAKVITSEWPGAFDEALNILLENIETEWVLRLDSDEWLAPGQAGLLEEEIKKPYELLLITREDFFSENSSSEMSVMRLWKNHPQMRYIGVVHEHFPRERLDSIPVAYSNFRILHDGYLGGVSKEKIERNVLLVEKELQIRPGQLYYENCLADSYIAMGDPRGEQIAERIVDTLLASPVYSMPIDAGPLPFCILLENYAHEKLFEPRTEKMVKRLWDWFSTSPLALWPIGAVQLARGNYWGALHALKRLYELNSRGELDRTASFSPIVVGEGLWTNIAIAAAKCSEFSLANEMAKRANIATPIGPTICDTVFASDVSRRVAQIENKPGKDWETLVEDCLRTPFETAPTPSLDQMFAYSLQNISPADYFAMRTEALIWRSWLWFSRNYEVLNALSELESKRGNVWGAIHANERLLQTKK